MKHIKNTISLSVLLLMFATFVQAQAWEIPDGEKSKTNPLELNAANSEKGFEVYQKNCKSCHGDVGAANFMPLVPPPTDLGSAAFKTANTDGEIFYKMTTGRGAMPSFKAVLSDDERWAVIAYLRAGDKTDATVDKNAKLSIVANPDDKSISASITTKDATGKEVKLVGADIEISIKRIFGNLTIGKGKTNATGAFSVNLPEDLPGDSLGKATIIVVAKRFKQEEKIEIDWATPSKHHDLTAQASIWGTSANAPWWIMLLYIGIAGSVWVVIIYIVLQIFKIARLAKKNV